MIKKELKQNRKNFFLWFIITAGIFFLIFLLYPSIVNENEIESMDAFMKAFPKEVIEAMNMDLSSMTSAFGWFQSEGFIFFLLLTSCYGGLLGSNILLKEESDKTIEYLNSLPIKRHQIIIKKVVVSLFYIISLIILLAITNYIGLRINEEIDKKTFILLSITPLFSSITFFFLCLFLSTFTHKTKKMIGLTLGLVFISYIFSIIANMADSVEFLKYISLFTLTDVRHVIQTTTIDGIYIALTVVISITLLLLTLYRYHKKELV